jgi:hypothetical protein
MDKKNEPEMYTIFDDNDTQEFQSISIIQEPNVQTIIPRRRQQTARNGSLYSFYKPLSIDNGSSHTQKRSSSRDAKSSQQKKLKEPPEIVILD